MSAFKEIASFKTFITPTLIRAGFWLGVVAGLLSSVGGVIFGVVTAVASGKILMGLALMVGAVFYLALFLLYWRVMCELILVVFGIYERLDETADIIKESAAAGRPIGR